MNPPKKVLLLTLKTFSLTGGIEKVCRGLAFAFQQMHDAQDIHFQMLALYDDAPDERYVKASLFSSFHQHLFWGMWMALQKGIKQDVVVLSHINLAPIGLGIKLLSPNTRLILWTHGIEVWRPINWFKKRFLKKVNQIVAVSEFTAESLSKWHGVEQQKVKVIPNALDPFFEVAEPVASDYLHLKYDIPKSIPVFIALTRLSASERNKNYALVIQLLGVLKKEGKLAYYLLCGKFDAQEHESIKMMAKDADLEKEVILSGFVKDEELKSYYQGADAFVLPSIKEGFGLVFMEAQAFGLPVLAGNQDGSTAAVKNDQFNILIDPSDKNALKDALYQMMLMKPSIAHKKAVQNVCLNDFSFKQYQKKIATLMAASF